MKQFKIFQRLIALSSKSFLLLAILMIGSCKKDFLKQEPRDSLSDEYVNDALKNGGIANVLNALYWSLNPRWTVEDANNWMFMEALSDNSNSGGDDEGGYNKTKYFQITPESTFGNRWAYFYKVIVESNNAINSLYKLFDKDGTSKEMAEAKFYRGWAYFELGRSFGGVILLDENTKITDEAAKKRASLADTYNFAVNDFMVAMQYLTENKTSAHPTKWTAKAILGKLYVYQNDWAKAKDQLLEVVHSGKYDLLGNFNDIFQIENQNSTEIVFSIDCTDKGLADWSNSDYMLHGNILFGFCGPLVEHHKDYMDGWGYALPTENLATAFDAAGDTKRKVATLLSMVELKAGIVDENGNPVPPDLFELSTPDFGWEGYYNKKLVPLKKYKSLTGEQYINYPQDYMMMRFSEVLYLAAEACLQSGAIGQGQPLFDKVRSRVGLVPLILTIDNLLKDKRLELAMEGERFFDLVRYNKAAEVLGNKGFTANKNEVFAIPQGEIDKIGTTLLQNPGY